MTYSRREFLGGLSATGAVALLASPAAAVAGLIRPSLPTIVAEEIPTFRILPGRGDCFAQGGFTRLGFACLRSRFRLLHELGKYKLPLVVTLCDGTGVVYTPWKALRTGHYVIPEDELAQGRVYHLDRDAFLVPNQSGTGQTWCIVGETTVPPPEHPMARPAWSRLA